MNSIAGLERPTRLASGLILFAFAALHLINHAFGVASVDAMQAAGAILLAPWRTYPGLIVLYGALLIHAALGFVALYRRRHLRMPPAETWQGRSLFDSGRAPRARSWTPRRGFSTS